MSKCKDCGKEMEMYYGLKCFHCKKPVPDEKDRGNLLMARNWLNNNEPEFDKDEFWTECLDLDLIESNDSWTSMITQEDLDTYDSDDYPNIRLFKKHFPGEETLWMVSW